MISNGQSNIRYIIEQIDWDFVVTVVAPVTLAIVTFVVILYSAEGHKDKCIRMCGEQGVSKYSNGGCYCNEPN